MLFETTKPGCAKLLSFHHLTHNNLHRTLEGAWVARDKRAAKRLLAAPSVLLFHAFSKRHQLPHERLVPLACLSALAREGRLRTDRIRDPTGVEGNVILEKQVRPVTHKIGQLVARAAGYTEVLHEL